MKIYAKQIKHLSIKKKSEKIKVVVENWEYFL